MRIALRRWGTATAFFVPTAIAMIVLAVLQYRWSNQVSGATSIRLADSLQMSMTNWYLNLLRDLSDVRTALQVESVTVGPRELDEQARRFQEWRSSAPYPNLVAGLYVLPEGSGTVPVLTLDPSGRQFEAIQRPPRLDRLWNELQQTSDTLPGGRAGTFDDRRRGRGDWYFDPKLPALVRSLSAAAGLFPAPAHSRSETAAWLVVELSTDVTRVRLLPDLARRYFTGVDGLDYQVALVAGTRPRRVLYASDPGFGDQDPVDADGRLDLFGGSVDQTSGSPIYVFHKPLADTGVSAWVGMPWFPLLLQRPADEDWQLVVRHRRGGPLGSFVAQAHRRDLAVSLGGFVLLAVSISMWIVASDRAQRLARLQLDFVTAVSHELRTPLTIIRSAADNIARGFIRDNQQLVQYGTVIGNQARRLSDMVEQVLLFGSTQELNQQYLLRPVDIPEVIDATLTVLAGLIQESHVRVERDIQSNLPPAMGDPLALSQCLQNLITNGLKYGGEPRWLGIRASLVKDRSRSEIQVSVCDRGLGIAASDLRHIFKPFYRSPSVAAAQIPGTGLGLTVARSLAEAMKGQLTVTSCQGRGSTFTVHLLCADQVSQIAATGT
jgi:signal transduction histidine kinase